MVIVIGVKQVSKYHGHAQPCYAHSGTQPCVHRVRHIFVWRKYLGALKSFKQKMRMHRFTMT